MVVVGDDNVLGVSGNIDHLGVGKKSGRKETKGEVGLYQPKIKIRK